MIETVELQPLEVIGVAVTAHWNDLPKAIPAAWTQLFLAAPAERTFVEVSIDRQDGVYRELVGFVATDGDTVPAGMIRYRVPAGTFLHIVHDGPLPQIADRFADLYNHAAANDLRVTDFKLDFGYAPRLPAGRHQLYVALA
jgi:predicted transcriptional regulator YdeE